MTAEKPWFIGLHNGNLSLSLCPAAGGSIAAFRREGAAGPVDLFRPYDPKLPPEPRHMASFPLTPYSNRIIDCRLRFRDRVFEVGPPTAPEPHQLHGTGWMLPWNVKEANALRAVLTLQTKREPLSPYVYEARQTFTLEKKRLTIEMSVTNRSGIALPFGLGHHPYFIRNERTIFKARLPQVWLSKNIVPVERAPVPPPWDFSGGPALSDAHFGPPRQGVGGADLLDHCFEGWDGAAEITWPDKGVKLTLRADPVFAHFVMYVPARKKFFCAEPVTHCNDGFNLMDRGVSGTGTAVLEEGATLKGKIWFEPDKI